MDSCLNGCRKYAVTVDAAAAVAVDGAVAVDAAVAVAEDAEDAEY